MVPQIKSVSIDMDLGIEDIISLLPIRLPWLMYNWNLDFIRIQIRIWLINHLKNLFNLWENILLIIYQWISKPMNGYMHITKRIIVYWRNCLCDAIYLYRYVYIHWNWIVWIENSFVFAIAIYILLSVQYTIYIYKMKNPKYINFYILFITITTIIHSTTKPF
mgnify:CR=1 FL=1